ncbi:zinc-binding alcohol dehydrogenase family protein [Algoriphagus sp. C2-6-M1]|uniref:zinc-binding alcohol dehydrogenase family protein n=1 Tax=Algoriphagus persicinus TaxID=3108754 RepID=UPI002B3929F8|nr:zinc-binding alcohol dehydrogenase family protein [Algoriphagus sp. C2-6-M1]MEB2782032.1 zinc-binding alcohol dehydrogenase family protein [Algoriphagus sp. C2-6-M1]
MKTVILKEPGSWEVSETSVDRSLEDDQVLLKVHRIGICGTDMHAFRGKQPFFSYPRILGHELGLEVVEKGRLVSRVKIGDKCALEPYFNFKEDQAVKLGKTNCGEFISVFGVHQDGGMQEFIKVPARYLHKSSKLSYDQLALIEPLGIGCHAVSRANITSEDKVLVIGAGPIGLATMQFATIKLAKVAALDINEDRLRFCMQNLDLEGTVNANSTDVIGQLRNLFDGDLPTVVMDATGNEHSMKNTLNYVAFGGRIVFIGLYQGDFTFFDPLFHRKEITLLASRNALGADFEEIISLMEEGKVATDHWITHRVRFDDLPKRFESLLNPESGVIKAMVEL